MHKELDVEVAPFKDRAAKDQAIAAIIHKAVCRTYLYVPMPVGATMRVASRSSQLPP
jgi:hypothetical protein